MRNLKQILIRYKMYIIGLAILILSIISIVMQDVDRKNSLVINSSDVTDVNDGKIIVYISGAVQNPGIYKLDSNARIYNLLDLCGGVLENADLDKINPAQKLNDSDKIVIPEKKEISEEYEDVDDYEESQKININEATITQLQELNGIGAATAKKIIEYRKDTPFNTIEDIMNVPGIGESKFNNIKNDICTK